MPETKPERACQVCGAHIDHDANPRKIHCSNKCSVAAYRARQKLKSSVQKVSLPQLKREILEALIELKSLTQTLKQKEIQC